MQRYIFEEECGYAGTPPLIPFGLTMCAAVLLQFGDLALVDEGRVLAMAPVYPASA